MPDPIIVDQKAISFANQRLRISADMLAKMYANAKLTVALWNALSVSATLTNTSDLLVDGAPADGRNAVTGAQATAIVSRLEEFITDYEAGSNAKLNTVYAVAPNP